MKKLHNRGKRILIMLLVFAMLCTSLPCTPTIAVHAAQTGGNSTWYEVSSRINASWGGHISGEITITNSSRQVRQDWQLIFPWQAQITSMWNGRYELTEKGYLISPMEYNAALQPDASVTIGFLAEGEDSILDSLASENFFTECGAEITDAEERASRTAEPEKTPVPKPTVVPTAAPTEPTAVAPTETPTEVPTVAPKVSPAVIPTASPTMSPTASPTVSPTASSTVIPTASPTVSPTASPTASPTVSPTASPTVDPTASPTMSPTASPTVSPTVAPTATPTATSEPDRPDLYLTSGITLQENTTCGNLYVLSGGYVNLNGYSLTVQQDIRIHTDRNAFAGSGAIRLGGNLFQSPAAAEGSLRLESSARLVLCGSQTQKMELAYPESSYLGQLALGDSQEVYLPEEIHCYSLSRLDKAHFPDTVRIQARYVYLDSDFEVPGNLVLLGGGYWTRGHHVTVHGNLSLQEEANLDVSVEAGSRFSVQGDLELNGGRIRTDGDKTEMTAGGSIRLNSGTLGVYKGIFRTKKNLAVGAEGEMALWGGLLEIGGNWETNSTIQRSQFHEGVIDLCGNLIQGENASVSSVNMEDAVTFRCKGKNPQHIHLQYPEQISLGRLQLGESQEVYLPEEIHCYSLSRLDKAHFPDTVRIQARYVYLDSDFEVPGNLVLLGGGYWTRGHHVTVHGNLSLQKEANLDVSVEAGSRFSVQGDLELNGGRIRTDGDKTEITAGGSIRLNSGTLGIYKGIFRTMENLTVGAEGEMSLWGGLLEIGGNWETDSTIQRSQFHEGVIDLYGNLIQGENANIDSITMENAVVFRLRGNELQTVMLSDPDETRLGRLDLSDSAGVSFESNNNSYSDDTLHLTGASLKNLEKIKNKDSLCLDFDNIYLENDLDYPGDLECQGNLKMNGHSLTIRGDLDMDGSLTNPGTLDIYGNYTAVSGATDCGAGTIRVRKNLRLRETASLYMREVTARLLVEGNFKTSATGTSILRAGTIELKGDLTCTAAAYDDNLKMTGTILQLSGTSRQNIDLYAGKCHIDVARIDMSQAAEVHIENALLYATYIKGFDKIVNSHLVVVGLNETLEQDEHYHGSLQIIGKLLDCAGYSFLVDGALEVSDTVCVLNKGTLSVRRSFIMYGSSLLQMRQKEDLVIVGGSFRTLSLLCHSGMLTNGRMVLSGNFSEEGTPYSFDSTDEFTVAFVSTQIQYLHYDNPETCQIANIEGDFIKDESWDDKICLTMDAVTYGVADGLGELAESPDQMIAAGAAAAGVVLGTTLGIPGVAGVICVLGIGGIISASLDTYRELSDIDNGYEQQREIVKKITKLAVLSAVMKASGKGAEKVGEYVKDTVLWQKCCKFFKNRKQPNITEEELRKIAMEAAEHLESVKGCMTDDAYELLQQYNGKYTDIDAMDVAEIIQTVYTRTEKELAERDIKILYQRLVDGSSAESIYHILVVTERFEGFSDFDKEFALKVGKDADLSIEEKVWKLQKGYENVADKTDVMVPADARYLKGFKENGKPDYKWPKFLGFIRSTIRSITREDGLPIEIDRYGYNGGTNFAAVPKKGRYSFLKRAIPYLQNEKSYHKFKVKHGENYCDKIDAIASGKFDKLNEILVDEKNKPITEREFAKIYNNYLKQISEMQSEEGITADVTYGLKGTVAQYHSKTPELVGGAEQYTLPLSADDLIKIKVLEE